MLTNHYLEAGSFNKFIPEMRIAFERGSYSMGQGNALEWARGGVLWDVPPPALEKVAHQRDCFVEIMRYM